MAKWRAWPDGLSQAKHFARHFRRRSDEVLVYLFLTIYY